MKQWVFFLLVFAGTVQLVLSVAYKFYLIQQLKTWSDAQTYCRAEHVDQATIDSVETLNQIQSEALSWGFIGSAWIGLYKDMSRNSWHWSLGNQTALTVSQWGPGSPATQDCAAVISNAVYDLPCSRERPFICYDATQTGANQYIYYYLFLSWFSAQAYCRQYHTDLTCSRDVNEFTALNNKIVDPLYFTWIGLFKDFWIWSDHSNSSLIPWMTGEPDDAAGNENCGYLANGQTGDEVCTALMPFFCYGIIIGQQRVIRLRVQSNQDVNDPTESADLLQQIYNKLVEHGLKGYVKISWRKQPGGEVFHKLIEKVSLDNTTLSICKHLDF